MDHQQSNKILFLWNRCYYEQIFLFMLYLLLNVNFSFISGFMVAFLVNGIRTILIKNMFHVKCIEVKMFMLLSMIVSLKIPSSFSF